MRDETRPGGPEPQGEHQAHPKDQDHREKTESPGGMQREDRGRRQPKEGEEEEDTDHHAEENEGGEGLLEDGA
jgi:hypothetical protein